MLDLPIQHGTSAYTPEPPSYDKGKDESNQTPETMRFHRDSIDYSNSDGVSRLRYCGFRIKAAYASPSGQ